MIIDKTLSINIIRSLITYLELDLLKWKTKFNELPQL